MNVTSYQSEIAQTRTYLHVPYAHKDVCKQMGGFWDGDRKQWFITAGTPLLPFSIWLEKPKKAEFVTHVSHVSLFGYLKKLLESEQKLMNADEEKLQLLVQVKNFHNNYSGCAVIALKQAVEDFPVYRVAMSEAFQATHPVRAIPITVGYGSPTTILSIDENLEICR